MSILRSLVPAPLKPVAKRVRRAFRRVAHHAPISTDFRAAIGVKPVPFVVAGRPFECELTITNHTPAALSPHGANPVSVSAEWRAYTGELCGVSPGFVTLPRPLWPGETLAHTFAFNAPESLGDYIVEFALKQVGGPGFERVGPRAKFDTQTTMPPDAEFNYHDIYEQADLTRDFWTASGPPSAAEFERLVPIKLKLLTDLGLTPDSKLLDVGCGTGLLATAAEKFLSDRGAYYGTDLAKEAVEFCKTRYRRPNFHFVRNGMTTIPIDGVKFDAAAYYSVFTHTFPDETALLLAETKRLLAPTGFVFADLFTSPLVQRHAGTRFAVEVNRDLTLRLIELTGLKAELVMSSPWKGQARREFYKFTHR
jgi:ubiquinone/menaquinone biosynthesis C-methylase UbiE